MADEKKTDNVLPGDQPPTNEDGTLKIDPAAQKATEANEKAAAAGEANTGQSASTNPTPLPAGEMRPSIDVPSLLPPAPNAAPDLSQVPTQGKAADDLLVAQQDVAWTIQHQPVGVLPTSIPDLTRLHEQLQAERYKEKPNGALAETARRKLAGMGIAAEALPSGRKDK